MSAGDYPFSTLTGTNLLDQIVAPKIVWGGPTGYVVQADLGNLDTIYSTNMGSTSNPINQINATTIGTTGVPVSNLYATNIGDPNGAISTLYVQRIGNTGIRQPNGPRVSDIYVDTLHYLNLDPIVTGGTVTGVGNTGPTGPTGISGINGVTGATGATGIGISGTTFINGNLIITYTNGVTANSGYIKGPTGTTISVDPSIITTPYGTPAYITQSKDSTTLYLQFAIPSGQPGTGFTGASGGSGSAFSSGNPWEILYYNSTGGGISGNNNFLYDEPGIYGSPTTLYTPSTLISGNPATEVFINSDVTRTYLQPGTASSSGTELYVNKPYKINNPAAVFDTENNRVAVNKILDDALINPYTSLDVSGQTKITYPGLTTTSAVIISETALSGTTSLPIMPNKTYKIYGWGEGGTGPNAFAGGEIEYVTAGTTLNWNYIGGGTGVYSGGNALYLYDTAASNPTIPVAVAYGGGGGYTGSINISDPSAGGNASQTAGGAGGRIITNQQKSPQIYDMSNVVGLTASINSANISNFSTINFSAGTKIKFSQRVQNSGGVIIIPPNTSCSINTSNATFTADISSVYTGSTGYGSGITGVSFIDGFFLDTTVNSTSIIIPPNIIGVTEQGVYGDGVAATGTSNIHIDGKNVNVFGVTGFSSKSITWSNQGYFPGAVLNFPNGGGFLLSPATNINDVDAENFTMTGAVVANNFLNISNFTAYGSLTTNLTFPSGSKVSVQGYGSNNYAGYGISIGGGTAISGGGGGGGYYGGGGGYFNIGGNGSSFGPIINDGYQNYPYVNKYNKNVYAGPRQKGAIVIETITTTTNPQPALIVNGNESLNGTLTINGGGQNLAVPAGSTQALQNITASSLTTTGSVTTNGITVGNLGAAINGNVVISGGNFTTSGTITATGNITTSGDVIAFSDRRMKENIEGIESPLEKIMKMHGVYFTRINNPRRQIGVIAQEVEEVLPEVVFTDETSNKNKSVSYGNIVALLIEGMKEQQKMIEDLKRDQKDH